jgi:Domain of Unknown Function (DUF928)
MMEMKLPLSQIELALTIGLVLLSFTPVQAEPIEPLAIAQSLSFNSRGQLNETIIFNAPPPPDDINAPGNRVGGGKRGCENMDNQRGGANDKPLTALVPVYKLKDSEVVLGLTTASHPTFWFYVPYLPKVDAEFVLQDAADRTVYKTPVSLSKTPGVVSFSLPSIASPLEIGKRYHWYFNIYCSPQQPPVFVDGWIQREFLNPILKSQLEKATPKQRVALFATQGYWYEALTAAAEIRRTAQNDTNWVAMLQTVGLADIASKPMVEAVTKEVKSMSLLPLY